MMGTITGSLSGYGSVTVSVVAGGPERVSDHVSPGHPDLAEVVATADRVPVTDLGHREELLTLGVRPNRAIVECRVGTCGRPGMGHDPDHCRLGLW
jgi:hypothetical protein